MIDDALAAGGRMPDASTTTVLGTVTLDPAEHSDVAWSRVRDLAQAGGLAPLPAARLALAATGLLDNPRSASVVRLIRVTDHEGTRVEAVIHGPAATGSDALPDDLVDVRSERTFPAGPPERVFGIATDPTGTSHRLSWTPLSDAAAHASNTRQLLAVALVAASRQRAVPGTVDMETTALRLELDETNRGMLALHEELSHHQDQLEQARAAAEEATHAKAIFLANMSHEIRAPMNAVVGFNGLLLETDLSSEQLEYAQAVGNAGRHLLGVINDILDLSKIESGRLELEDVPFDLYACVEDAVELLAFQASAKHLPVAALFEPGTPVLVGGDPLRLGQILVNLLGNAVKFTAHGQVTVEVAHQPGDGDSQRLTFRVTDTGPGMPPETLSRLFIPFTQGDASTTRDYGGTGLGLSICGQLARQMSGTITVESTVGEGSTFTCAIAARTVTPSGPSADSTLLAGSRILVIHRSALVTEAIRRHLTSWGAAVITALNVDDAITRTIHWPGVDLALVESDREAAGDQSAVTHDLVRLGGAYPDVPIVSVTALTTRAGGDVIAASVPTPIRRAGLRDVVLGVLRPTAPHSTAPAATTPEPPSSRPSEPRQADPRQATCRVLYVDDNPMMVQLVERILSRDPSVVLHTASSGRTALDLAASRELDLILLDLNLTDIGGDVLLNELQAGKRTRAIPVVIVSGDAAPETIERLTRMGAAGYLTKPFQPGQLRELVRSTGPHVP